MTQPKPRIKFTINDYMTTPDDKRYQLLDGELILAPESTTRHQWISSRLYLALEEFVRNTNAGRVFYAPTEVVLSDHDVVQPDTLYVSNARADIVTEANKQGPPVLVGEVLSPGTVQDDRGYKRTFSSRHGVLTGGSRCRDH